MKSEEDMHGEETPKRKEPMSSGFGWETVEYVLMWPFMCHIASVFVVAWIASLLHFHVYFIFLLGLMYLYQVEKRQREKLCRSIQHEEKKNCYKARLSEGETVRWMNRAVERIWPIFLENFASQMLLLPMSPWFLNMYKPWTAKKAIVQHLSLGKNPPVITMLRTLEDSADGDHLTIEASMEFGASKDMSAVLAVQIRRRLGLGIWTSFHISNVHLEGKVRIGVRFVNGWPVIGRTRVCFTTPPILQMTARPLFNFGVDVTEIPGIAQWLDRIIAFALEQSLVEPNMLVVDVEKLVSGLMFPPPPSQQPQQADWFHMDTKPPVASVLVEILEAAELRSADLNGLSDPFVKGTLSTKKFSTKIRWKTLNPRWDEKFELPIASWELPNLLLLQIFDKDRFHSDDNLGFCAVSINEYQDGERHEMWLPLKQVNTGKIHLAVTVTNLPATTNGSDKPTNSSDEPPSNTSGIQVESQDLKTKDLDRNLPISTKEMASPESSDGQLRATDSMGDNSSKRQQASEQIMAHANENVIVLDKAKSSAQIQLNQSSASERDSTSGKSAIESSKQTTAPGVRPIEPGKQTGDQIKAVVDIGLGFQPGSIYIAELGDEKPTQWPCQKDGKAKNKNARVAQETADNPPMGKITTEPGSIIGDGNSAAGALKPEEVLAQTQGQEDAGLFHRKQNFTNEHTMEDVHVQDVSLASCDDEHVAVAPNGTVVEMVMEGFDKHAMDNADKLSATGFHPHQTPDVLDPQRQVKFGDVVDNSESDIGDADGHHHKRGKAKGFFNIAYAAIRVGKSLSRRFKSKWNTESGATKGQASFRSTKETPGPDALNGET